MITDATVSDKSINTVEKPVILVVDDSRVIRLALKKMLQKEFTLIEAGNGEEAWSQLLDDESIQVVFSDLSMPELDGFGLLKRIRSSGLDRISKVPFIVITGNEDDEKITQQALDCGATDLVTKPFQSREIKDRAHTYARNYTDSEIHSSSATSLLDDIEESVDNLSSIGQMLKAKGQEVTETDIKNENADVKHNPQDHGKQYIEEELTSRFEEIFSQRKQDTVDEQNLLNDVQEFMHSDFNTEALANVEETVDNDLLREEKSAVESNPVLENEVEGIKEEKEFWVSGGFDENSNKDPEISDLGRKIREHVRQKEALALVQREGELETFVAFDVNQRINDNYKDNQGSDGETEMIRIELEKKLAIEREQQLASCSPFTRFIISVLEQINTHPWVNLDNKIKIILKRNAR